MKNSCLIVLIFIFFTHPPSLVAAEQFVSEKSNLFIVKSLSTAPSSSTGLSPEWYTKQLPWNSSPIDLSFLNSSNKPAGIHGFLSSVGDSLVFNDGTPVRFWGANIQAHTLFGTSDLNIKKQAKRISRLGFNLVRFHHHDSQWVKPNIFKHPRRNTLLLNAGSFKKLDWWIKCLKEEGVYVWLDLQVGRSYTPNDGIDDFSEIAKGKPFHQLRGFNYYNKSIQQKMMDFNRAYLSHINPFTKLAYKNDPAIVSILLINENDLTRHFGNALLADKKVPKHHQLYNIDVNLASKRLGLDPEKAWRAWEYGEPKIYLNDAEHRYNQKMLRHLRISGLKNTLITGNTWGGMSLASLPSLTDGDIIDVHSYGRKGELSFNPRHKAGLLSWIGAAQVTNKPLSVTEWNVEKFPVVDRFTIPVWLASVASLQGWDSLMLYGYGQSPLNTAGKGHNYSTYNDPALMAMMPASALLYRQQHVAEAKKTFHIRLQKNTFFGKAINPSTSKSLRTLVEQSKINIDLPYSSSLPWLKEYEDGMEASYNKQSNSQHVINDPNVDFIPADQSIVISDTNELSRNWLKGIHLVNTAKSQIASGKIGDQLITLKNTSFNIDTEQAVIAIQSLDDLPLEQSNKILISKIARSTPTKQKSFPFISEPILGTITIHAKAGLELFEITSTHHKPLESNYINNTYKINLNEKNISPWLILK